MAKTKGKSLKTFELQIVKRQNSSNYITKRVLTFFTKDQAIEAMIQTTEPDMVLTSRTVSKPNPKIIAELINSELHEY